jgi:DNA-binding NtrC family response regulator
MTQKAEEGRWQRSFACSPGQPVLLINEEPAKLHLYSVILRELGCRVVSCGTFQDGVRLLDSSTFGLVIVSQGSGKFEGRRVLERAAEIDRHLPVLVVARHPEMRWYMEAMQLGAVDYLAEPVTTTELDHAVRTHLRTRIGFTSPVLDADERQSDASLS